MRFTITKIICCQRSQSSKNLNLYILFTFFLTNFFGYLAPIYADEFNWAEESFNPQEKAPEGLHNNISLPMLSAIEGLFEPRFQHYFLDSLAYYLQLQLGSHLVSSLNFSEEYQQRAYKRFQLGFELGLSSLLYARTARITKDTRLWGSGLVTGLGLRFMYSSLSGSIQDDVLSSGFATYLGWQLQARNFSISMYLQFRILLHFSIRLRLQADTPFLTDRSLLSQSLPRIPIVNNTQINRLAAGIFYAFSQTLNIRISYYF